MGNTQSQTLTFTNPEFKPLPNMASLLTHAETLLIEPTCPPVNPLKESLFLCLKQNKPLDCLKLKKEFVDSCNR